MSEVVDLVERYRPDIEEHTGPFDVERYADHCDLKAADGSFYRASLPQPGQSEFRPGLTVRVIVSV